MIRVILLTLLLSSSALAQQAPDVATLQKAINILQQQRNAAMDQAATAEIRAVQAQEESEKLREELKKLQGDSGAEKKDAK